jgi:ribosomal protein L21E
LDARESGMQHKVQTVALLQFFLKTFWRGDLVYIIAENMIQRLRSRRFQGQPANNENVRLEYRRCDSSFSGYHISSF